MLNENYFNNDIQKYLTSEDPKASFNSQFHKYTDVLKQITDVTAKAGIDGSVVDYIYNKKGLPTDVMTTEEIKTNLPKIKAAIELVTQDGNVQKQLQIDGWNKYKNVSALDLYNPMVETYNKRQVEIEQKTMDLNVLLSASNLTANKKQELEQQQSLLKKEGVNSQTTFEYLGKLAQDNPDAFKENLYSTEYKQNLLEAFSSETHNTRYNENPAMKQFMSVLKFNFDKEQERNTNYYKAANLSLEQAKFNADYEVDPNTGVTTKKETGKTKYKPNDATNQPNQSGSNSTDINTRLLKFNQDISNLETENNVAAVDVFTEYLSLTNNGKTKDGKVITKEIAIAEAKKMAASTGEKVEDLMMRFSLNAKSKLEDSKLKAPAQIQAKIDRLAQKQELYGSYKLAEMKANQVAEEATKSNLNTINSMVMPAPTAYQGAFGLPVSAQLTTPIRTKEGAALNNLYQETKNRELSRIIPYYNNLSTQGVDLEKSKAKVLEFVNTTPSLAGVPEGDREGIVEALTKSETGLSFGLEQPLFVGQPWVANAIISYKGKEFKIPNVPTNATGKTLQPYELDPDEILIEMTGTNSTSPVNPNIPDAHKVAKYSPSKFTGLDPKSPYVVKGNIVKVENPKGGLPGSQLVFYIKEGEGEFKNIQGPVIYPGNGVDNPTAALKQYLSKMTDANVKYYLNENK